MQRGRRPDRAWAPRRAVLGGCVAALCLAVFAGFGGIVARAADESLPAAEVIIEKSIEASGGREAIGKLTSRKSTGRMELPAMGLKVSAVEYSVVPQRSYMRMDSPEIGQIVSGSDGTIFWETSQMTGPRLREGDEMEFSKRTGFTEELRWRDHYPQAETTGIDTVDGRPCYTVVVTPKQGQPETRYYDVETYMLLRQDLKMASPMGEIPVEFYFTDYREVDGLIMSMQSRQVLMGGAQEMLFVTDSVWFNVEIPDSLFEVPEQIQALVAKKALNLEQKPGTEEQAAPPDAETKAPGE
ncbi:MAG: hypothetical protein V1774_00525 [Candidatus Eisenbacteria bacterium]